MVKWMNEAIGTGLSTLQCREKSAKVSVNVSPIFFEKYRYRRYFHQKVLVSISAIIFESIVNNSVEVIPCEYEMGTGTLWTICLRLGQGKRLITTGTLLLSAVYVYCSWHVPESSSTIFGPCFLAHVIGISVTRLIVLCNDVVCSLFHWPLLYFLDNEMQRCEPRPVIIYMELWKVIIII